MKKKVWKVCIVFLMLFINILIVNLSSVYALNSSTSKNDFSIGSVRESFIPRFQGNLLLAWIALAIAVILIIFYIFYIKKKKSRQKIKKAKHKSRKVRGRERK